MFFFFYFFEGYWIFHFIQMSNIYATYSRNGEENIDYIEWNYFMKFSRLRSFFQKIFIFTKKKNHLLAQPIQRKSTKFLYETETN